MRPETGSGHALRLRTRRLAILICVVLGGWAGLTGRAADLGSTNGTQWHPFLQWTIENASWEGNPFDVQAAVEFTHAPSGEKRRTDMFYLGKRQWAFRFTGTTIGTWSFVTSSGDRELDGHTGKVLIGRNAHAGAHGFLKSFGNKWGWEGSEEVIVPQLVMWDYIAGGNSPQLFHNKPKLVDERIEEFLGAHGFNGFHLPVIAGRWFDLHGSEKTDAKLVDPDPRTFEALELLITKTHRAGGMVHIWPWGDHQRAQTPRTLAGGIGGAVDRRLQRYLATRLGPVPGWSMGYGFDLDEWVGATELRKWRDAMHERMGWSHFLGGRPEGPNHGTDHRADAAWNRGLDYGSYEHHRPSYEVYLAASRATPQVPALSEDRFRIRKNKYPEKDYDEERTRRGLYHSTMAGGVGNIWGMHPDFSAGGVYPNKHWIKTYAVFFHGRRRFLRDMSPAAELSDDEETRVLFSAGTGSLVAYRESTKQIHLDLSRLRAASPAVAVDTKKPYQELQLGDLKPVAQTIELPAVSDWVLAVGRFDPVQDRERDKAPATLEFGASWSGPPLNGGHGAMWADADGDGRPDLYLPLIISGTLPDLFMHNKGAGKFVEEGRARGIADPDGGSHGAAWCDLDNDGDYDLINGTTFDDQSGIQNDIFRNDGRGHFTEMKPPAIEAREEETRAFISFDMDRDGDLDLFAVSNYQGSDDPREERNEVYRNEGNFEFTAITSGDLHTAPAGQGATDTDYDGDGDVDVFAANRTGPVNILRNDGRGRFTLIDPASIGIRHRAGDGITTADVDRDGDLDLLLAGSEGRGQLYTNDGDGTFTHAQTFDEIDGYMGGFADLDNDGDLELYFAGDTRIYLNDGTGGFAPGPAVPVDGKADPRGVAFADFDGDGDIDFAIGDKRARRNYIVRNELRGGGNWLKVRLVTARGQAGAFGALTTVYPAGQAGQARLGVRESQCNCGYLGQNDPVLHFGLGDHEAVDVVVRFLDGGVSKRSAVPANQTILIRAETRD